MIQILKISNFVIINSVEINFSNKLTIITGETGAGKSILMDALGLLLGNRIETNYCFHTNKKCILEAIFLIESDNPILETLRQQDIEISKELIIRREISPNGKSRIFINDSIITLQFLKTISPELIDIHQQFDSLLLLEQNFQRNIIDLLCNHTEVLKKFQKRFKELQILNQKLEELQKQQQKILETSLLKNFLLSEIQEVQLKQNELEDLEKELKIFENAEFIKKQIAVSTQFLEENETPVNSLLKSCIQSIQPILKWEPKLESIHQRLQSLLIESKDIYNELVLFDQNFVVNPQRVEIINERLSKGFKLLQKHHVKSTQDLFDIEKQLQIDINSIENVELAIEDLKKEISILRKSLENEADRLSLNRKKSLDPFTLKVKKLLEQIGMPNATLKVSIQNQTMNQYGIDDIEFLFDSNHKNIFEPIKKIASGGELSRLMLCIKTILSENQNLPSMIFDEIDSGVSGESANKIAQILLALSKNNQIICITHLPQIASKGDCHYRVFKEKIDNKVVSNISLLNPSERIKAIAEMLSGSNPSNSALENAKELLGD